MVCKFQIRELQKEKPEDVSEGLFALSCGPDPRVKTCKACSVNVAPRREHGRLRHRAGQAQRRWLLGGPGAEEMVSWRAGHRRDGVLEGRAQRRWHPGGRGQRGRRGRGGFERDERGEQGGGGERKDKI